MSWTRSAKCVYVLTKLQMPLFCKGKILGQQNFQCVRLAHFTTPSFIVTPSTVRRQYIYSTEMMLLAVKIN